MFCVVRHAFETAKLVSCDECNETRCNTKPDCCPPGYHPRRVLIIVGQLIGALGKWRSNFTPPEIYLERLKLKTLVTMEITCVLSNGTNINDLE